MKTAMMINTNLPLRASSERASPTCADHARHRSPRRQRKNTSCSLLTPAPALSPPFPDAPSVSPLSFYVFATNPDNGQCKVEIKRIVSPISSPRFPHVVKAIQETGGSGVHDSDDDEFRAQRERATRRRRRGREGKGRVGGQ